MFLSILFSALSTLVDCNKIDVLKIKNVPFPTAGCCRPHHYAAVASSHHMDTDIPAFTVCYRMLIDSYNDDLFSPVGVDINGVGGLWYLIDRMCWKCGTGSDGYQSGLLGIKRLSNGGFPHSHQYNLARDIDISKWTHICYSYS